MSQRREDDVQQDVISGAKPLWRDWPLWVGAFFLAVVAGGAVLVLQEPIRTFFGSRETIAFLVYLPPFLPDDAASLLAGLSPLPLSLLFAIGVVVVGRLPGLVAANLIGAHGHALGPAGWALGAAGICLLAFVSWRYQERLEDALLRGIARLLRRLPQFLSYTEEEAL